MMPDLVSDILALLKRYGLDCMRYVPGDIIRCRAGSDWNGPNIILVEITRHKEKPLRERIDPECKARVEKACDQECESYCGYNEFCWERCYDECTTNVLAECLRDGGGGR